MHSAYHALPSPDDPSLNTFQLARLPLDLCSPDILADLESETQSIPTTPKGRLMTLLPEKRANRLAWCRAWWVWMSDGQHKWPRTSAPCEMVITCPTCAQYQALEQQRKYIGLLPYVPESGFTRMSFPLDLTDPKRVYNVLTRHLRYYLPKAPLLSKIKPASDRIEVLYCGAISPEALAKLQKLYPQMQALPCHASQFREELISVLAPDLPKDPEAIAALDAKYIDTRLLRFSGLSQEERSELSVKDREPITDNSHNSNSPKYHCSEMGTLTLLTHCPKCGKLPTKISKWQTFSDKEPAEDQWRDVVLYIPPPKVE